MAKMKVSLRRSIIFYIIAFVLIAMILSAGTSFVCDRLSNHIRAAYPETREKYYLTNVDGERLGEGTYISKQEIPYSEMDKKILGLLDVFPKISCPIVLIQGENDPHPPAGVSAPLEHLGIPLRQHLLPRCGHNPWREQYAREPFFRILKQEVLG